MKRLFFFFLLFFLVKPIFSFGLLEQELETTFKEKGLNKYFTNISLIFEDKNLSNEINKIHLKKILADSLNENYRIVDPIITHEIVEKNFGRKNFLKEKEAKKFFSASNSDILIYTDFLEREEKIVAQHKIFHKNTSLINEVHQSFNKNPFLKKKQELLLASIDKENSFTQNLDNTEFEDFLFENNPQDILFELGDLDFKKIDHSWIFYHPTAYFGHQKHIINANFSIENLEFPDLKANYFRYSLNFNFIEFTSDFDFLQDDLNVAYLRFKAIIFEGDKKNIPVNISGGLRSRLYRKNIDEQTEEEKRRENLSFFVVTSGYLNNLDLIYNFYLDNFSLGLGAKFILPHEISLLLDTKSNYQSNIKENFYTIGIEHFPSPHLGYLLSVNREDIEGNDNKLIREEKTTLGLKISF